MGWWENSQSDFVLELGQTSGQPHANLMQTSYQPWAVLVPTSGGPLRGGGGPLGDGGNPGGSGGSGVQGSLGFSE